MADRALVMHASTLRSTQSVAWTVVAHGDEAALPEVLAELERAVAYWKPKRDTMAQGIVATLGRLGGVQSRGALAAVLFGDVTPEEAERELRRGDTDRATSFMLAMTLLRDQKRLGFLSHRGYMLQ